MFYVIPIPETNVATIVCWHASAIDDDSEDDLRGPKSVIWHKQKLKMTTMWAETRGPVAETYKSEDGYDLDYAEDKLNFSITFDPKELDND